jgi:uncharacterized membrane protein YjjP (DUF1212 family)
MDSSDPVVLKHRELEQIALASLRVARLMMECGARAQVVQQGCSLVARGLGAEHMELRSGYASLAITVGSGINTITRMAQVGPLGVNYRLDHAIRKLVIRVHAGGLTPADVVDQLERLVRETPRHAPWVVAVAVGFACAAFGRLLGVDWPAFLPVALAGGAGQWGRHRLLRGGANVFVVAAVMAFFSATLGGLAARWAGSSTQHLAMIASVLLLVPGVPALNAQFDIMEGHPTLGSARAVSVMMLLVFIAIGVLMAQGLLGVRT